jgi:hypothetical protein
MLCHDMKSLFKTVRSSEPTPLVSLFAVVTTVLIGVFVYQKFFGSPYFDFRPMMMWLLVAIPAGALGAIFLQVRASERARQAAKQVNAAVAELQSNPRLSENSRTSQQPTLDRPLPEKDPFENL